jgi:hypothetical protein
MVSIIVLVIAFGFGCVTGVVVHLLSHKWRANDSHAELLFWARPADDY